MGSVVFGSYSTNPSYSAMSMRASGWPSDICGSSDSGSGPLTYRRVFARGGSLLPKKRLLLAEAAQPAAINATITTRTSTDGEAESNQDQHLIFIAIKLALAFPASKRFFTARLPAP